jgi:hypothetical protein
MPEEIRFSTQAKKWECPRCGALPSFDNVVCSCGYDSTLFVMARLKAARAHATPGGSTVYDARDTPRTGYIDPPSNTWMCPDCKMVNEDLFEPVCAKCGKDQKHFIKSALDAGKPRKKKKKKPALGPLLLPAALLLAGVMSAGLLLSFSPLLIYVAPVFLLLTGLFCFKGDRSKKKKTEKAGELKRAAAALLEQIAEL